MARPTTRKLIAVATALALLAGGAALFVELGSILSVPSDVRSADVIVVPGGDLDHRLPAAVDHLEAGRAPEIWVTLESDGPVLEEPEAIEDYARERGVADRVGILGRSTSQRQDAQLVADSLDTLGPDPVIAIVTSPWNLTRARLTFRRLLDPQGATVLAWPDDRPYEADGWWRSYAATTGVEAVKLAGTLALFGARPVAPGQDVPLSLPLRAIAGGFAVAALAGLVVRPVAHRLDLVSRPRLFRAHAHAVPLLGGVAILAGLGGGVLAGGGFSVGVAGAVAAGGVLALAAVGFVDDLVGLGHRSRLVWSVGAGGAAWLLGLRTQVFGAGIGGDVGDLVLTVAWFVGITHAVNLLDNLDGAAAGVGAFSALAISAVAAVSGQWVVAVGGAALAGALGGYLVHNVHPARLFMGDLGALGVGFALAALALALRPDVPHPLSFSVAALVLAVPVFDTVLVTVARVRGGRPVTSGGTDHTTHRLIERGWGVRGAAGALWGAQAALGAAAFAVATSGPVWGWTLVAVIGAASLAALVAFLRMPPWRPGAPGPGTSRVAGAIDRATGPLRDVIREAHANGLATSDAQTVRAAEDALERLERTRARLAEAGGDGPEPAAATDREPGDPGD